MSSAVLVVLALLHAVEPNSIDLRQGWRFRPEGPQSAAELSAVNWVDSDWATISAGARWENQGFGDIDGFAWYRRHVEVPAAWQGQRVWLVLGGVNDACEVYCNGQRINAFGDEKVTTFANRSLVAELSVALHPGDNVIAIRVNDWGGSGGLWHVPCLLTIAPSQLPPVPQFQGIPDFESETFRVVVDATGLGSERGDARLCVEMHGADKAPMGVEVPLPRGQNSTSVKLSVPGVNSGRRYELNAALRDAAGLVLGAPSAPMNAEPAEIPSWGGEYAGLKVLNSLVTQLYSGSPKQNEEVAFPNPRDGWVFISLEPDGPVPSPLRGRIDDRSEGFTFRVNPDGKAQEAMLLLGKGTHKLRIETVGGRIELRAVPELAYCYYLANPLIPPYGPYDKAWMDRYILPHLNTLVASSPPPEEDLKQWTQEGRRWVTNAGLPGLTSKEAPSADDVYKQWIATPGITRPEYGALIVDEFISASPAHYSAWGEAVSKLYADPNFAGKTFYAFCGDLYEDAHSLAFARGLMDRGGLFALERYIAEEPTLDIATSWMQQEFPETIKAWQAALPGSPQRLVYVLGVLCAPPESVDTLPYVDYNVLQEMQFNRMANDPAFFGLYGIMEYSASYADEESLRWAYRLVRHYAIEGRRDRLSKAPYLLDHVDNPDFAEGLRGWTVEGAADTGTMEGLSWLEGRYPRTAKGDTYLTLKRSTKSPNVVRQVLKNLEPGRTYSLKMFAVAPKELDVRQDLAVSVELDGAETIPERSFRYTYPSNYAHTLGEYNRDHPAYINYFRLVFRAGEKPIELHISDWGAPDKPVGPEGQELGVNFVQVQPYLMP